MKITPSIPKGTRDFDAQTLFKRNFILDTIRSVYELFGFEPIETPSIEKLKILTGKYGDEGDKLLFKILDSGDYLAKADEELLQSKDSAKLVSQIANKGLRYDLTVPFARYVAQHRNEITFPFKRYQMQAVWRADRPQKGRYREFYQCDADVIGSNSLLAESEFLQIYDHVFRRLGIYNAEIKLNNRKLLAGIAEKIGAQEQFMSLTIAIDKLDKIGMDGVKNELSKNGFSEKQIHSVEEVLKFQQEEDSLGKIEAYLQNSDIGLQGVKKLREVLQNVVKTTVKRSNIAIDITLARGLTYYTGTIFEATIPESGIGSVSGGGRYDDLTGMFGLNDVSGVGISFGLDRIYDVMEQKNLWPEHLSKLKTPTKALVTYMDETVKDHCIDFLEKLRFNGVNAEMYLEPVKLGKQFKYANDKGIPYVIVIGQNEIDSGEFQFKFMESGKQQTLPPAYIINALKPRRR